MVEMDRLCRELSRMHGKYIAYRIRRVNATWITDDVLTSATARVVRLVALALIESPSDDPEVVQVIVGYHAETMARRLKGKMDRLLGDLSRTHGSNIAYRIRRKNATWIRDNILQAATAEIVRSVALALIESPSDDPEVVQALVDDQAEKMGTELWRQHRRHVGDQ
ncbi:MAG: hypothetical protein WKH64_07670 [Chloroflexia bacterium]